MHPVLLRTPFFTIYTFGLLLAAAYLTALGWTVRGARRQGFDADAFTSLGMWAIVGALLGAKALLIVRSAGDYLATPSDLFSPAVLSSAGDFYGGFIGGLIPSALHFWRPPAVPFSRPPDVWAPAH